VDWLVRQLGLKTKGRRRFRTTTQRDETHRRAPNLLQGDFRAVRPNDKWLSDITYIATHEGWLYLAGIQDAFSRRIVGWSIGERLSKALVCDAWHMAAGRYGAPRLHLSDQGSQYTSHDYLKLLEGAAVQISMSDVGRCYDNAMQESFWGTLKTSVRIALLLHGRTHARLCSSTLKSGTTVSGGTRLWAIAAQPISSNSHAPDIFTVREIGVWSFFVLVG
jgi:putative transposase